MKRENYSGEFDDFEVPSEVWNNVEKFLDEEDRKKRGFIWWKIAAAVIILLGIGSIFLLDSDSLKKNRSAKKEAQKKEISKPEKQDKQEESTVDDNNKIASVESATPVQDSLKITTPTPFLMASTPITVAGTTVNLSATGGVTYSWTPSLTTTLNSTVQTGTYSLTVTNSKAATSFSNSIANQGFMSFTSPSGIDGGPVNVGRISGVIDGVYLSEHLPTKRMIPYQKLGEAGDQWMGDEYDGGGSHYDAFVENDFLRTTESPLSTFSIDVDGASYSNVRGAINRGELPDINSVRIEEFVNYFPYSYEEPKGNDPFSIHSEVGACPWNENHRLLKVGIKGRLIEKTDLPKNNLVFLLDVSGSMESPEKLELLKKGFRLLVNELREEDKVSICVYAGAAGLVLPPTSGANKDKILDALNNLKAGGSTAGGEGIELAYATAAKNFQQNGNNRVILATDGDFNVGISNDNALVELIEEKRKSGVFLTVLGFGHDNFQSSKMEKLANNGNGNFSFIDNILEAKKVLVTEMGATLQTIAKDVKIQMEFNPEHVSAYRLIGYENRLLQNEHFSNDTIDAGELGAGHTVTAIYELIPASSKEEASQSGTELKYSSTTFTPNGQFSGELATMKFRYKEPNGTVSKLIEQPIATSEAKLSDDFEFVQAVVEFGLILRNSKYAGTSNFDDIINRAQRSKGTDPYGYRNEFILLVEKARLLMAVE
jgi:Ca-activated chloride channel family protein